GTLPERGRRGGREARPVGGRGLRPSPGAAPWHAGRLPPAPCGRRARGADRDPAFHAARLAAPLRRLPGERRNVLRAGPGRLGAPTPDAARARAPGGRHGLGNLPHQRDGSLWPGHLLPPARALRGAGAAGGPSPRAALPATPPLRPLAPGGLRAGAGDRGALRALPLSVPRLLQSPLHGHDLPRSGRHLLRSPPALGVLARRVAARAPARPRGDVGDALRL